ncbi:MAG: YtxH domain-containing protein [Bacteroidota bacterium]
MSSSKLLLGVLIGAAAGSLLGVLFAPEKGKDTRKKIATKSGDAVDKLKKKFSDLIDSISAQVEGAAADAEDMVEKGKSKAHQLKADVQQNFS